MIRTIKMKLMVIVFMIDAFTTFVKAADFNILKYGAVGDGVTLNTAAIQKAINELAATEPVNGFRGAILLKPGIYHCENPININASGIVLRGSGSGENGGSPAGASESRPIRNGRRSASLRSTTRICNPMPGPFSATVNF